MATRRGVSRAIVVLGAGYAGLTGAQALGNALRGRRDYQVVLVDRRGSHELKPKLREAVGEWADCSVQVPIRDVLDFGQVVRGVADVAIAPYDHGAACHLRHHLAQVVEEASLQSAEQQREALLTVVVAGAGFVGVESEWRWLANWRTV